MIVCINSKIVFFLLILLCDYVYKTDVDALTSLFAVNVLLNGEDCSSRQLPVDVTVTDIDDEISRFKRSCYHFVCRKAVMHQSEYVNITRCLFCCGVCSEFPCEWQRLASSSVYVPRSLPRHLVCLLAWHQHVWLAVIWCQPRPHL